MGRLDVRLEQVSRLAGGRMKARLDAELKYARRVSLVNGDAYDALIDRAVDGLMARYEREGALTDGAALEAEATLSGMAAACKKYRLLMVGHAHIDVNWMWRYDETVSIALDTFRTALNLMKEFPKFTFAQSQASTYAIVEEHEPRMLEEIRARIASGQWEVSASTWVEADRNMPSAESVARHFLYTKRYLPKLLGVRAEDLNLDFEPDTFGHHQNVPDMLARAGIKYYYHCRGEENQSLYRWRSPSGAEILVYLEPGWYLGPVTGDAAMRVPEFCERFGTDAALLVYGVGDHGGGPTRRDLERIVDMGSWPIFPAVEFGTYREFFQAAEAARERIPVLTGERNPVFSGCYTTQTRIKQGNRVAERMLYDAESLGAFAALECGAGYDRGAFEKAWRRVLFNQFHDILPGSGVVDTREYAMAGFQEAFAAAASSRRLSRAAVAGRIDTQSLAGADLAVSTAEGAGVGFGVQDFGAAQVSRGGGKTRVFHLFNPLPFDRRQVCDLILWDYLEDPDLIELTDSGGRPLRHQLIDKKFNEYWQHEWARLMVEADVPALGYATVVLKTRDEKPPVHPVRADPRVEKPFAMALENDRVRAEFDASTGELTALVDKKTSKTRALEAGFRFIEEDPTKGMTSWVVGRIMRDAPVRGSARIALLCDGPLYKAYKVETRVGGRSLLKYNVSLRAGSDTLDFDVDCDWQETGSESTCVPQLAFAARLPEAPSRFTYDIPGGWIERAPAAMDLPSQGMIAAGGAALLCDSRYGFRGDGERMSCTLIRSSFDPDPYPEPGHHAFRLGLKIADAEGAALLNEAAAWNQRVEAVSGSIHPGDRAPDGSFLRASGAVVSGVKLAEDEDAVIVRLHAAESGFARLTFARPVRSARMVDALEAPAPGEAKAEGASVVVPVPAEGGATVKICFSKR